MKRAHLLRVASLGAVAMLFALALSPPTAGTKTARRPNIMFILSDDQRFDTIHALGNPEIQTPNLDRLVKRGFHFTERYRSQFRFEMFNALNRPQ